MTTAIQAVYVRDYDERTSPKPHIAWKIEIQAHVRSWKIWRRYSEFVELHAELTSAAGAPPAELPPKHVYKFTLFRSADAHLLEERRLGLERYLRAIIACKDDRWRETHEFRTFLGVPSTMASTSASSFGNADFTITSWLEEHTELTTLVRDVRADLNKRDALVDRGDVTASHHASAAAKKRLAGTLTRVSRLTDGLRALALAGLSEGELHRRTDMVARLQDDCEKLSRMAVVARRAASAPGPSYGVGVGAASRNPASETTRIELLGPEAAAASAKPVTRTFGASKKPPQETDATRPLDDHGVFQLQNQQMQQQDDQLTQLAAILQRQRHLGVAISEEIALQNPMLDELANEVDGVQGKIKKADKMTKRL